MQKNQNMDNNFMSVIVSCVLAKSLFAICTFFNTWQRSNVRMKRFQKSIIMIFLLRDMRTDQLFAGEIWDWKELSNRQKGHTCKYHTNSQICYLGKICWNLLFLSSFINKEIDLRGRPTITADSDHFFNTWCVYVRPSFSKSCKLNKFQVGIVIATCWNVGLAEWIIDDTHVLYLSWTSLQFCNTTQWLLCSNSYSVSALTSARLMMLRET